MARVRLPRTSLERSELPPVCVICGRAAVANVRKTFNWRPRWLFAASFVRVLLFFTIVAVPFLFIISEAQKRRATVDLPMCQRHRRYWVWRGFWVLAPLLVLVVSSLSIGILVLLQVIPFIGLDGVVASLVLIFVMWAVAAFIAEHSGLRAVEITKDDLILAGAHLVFADLMRGGRHAWETTEHQDNGWEEYDPYPRKPAATKVEGKR